MVKDDINNIFNFIKKENTHINFNPYSYYCDFLIDTNYSFKLVIKIHYVDSWYNFGVMYSNGEIIIFNNTKNYQKEQNKFFRKNRGLLKSLSIKNTDLIYLEYSAYFIKNNIKLIQNKNALIEYVNSNQY
jgi:hypothetical protein